MQKRDIRLPDRQGVRDLPLLDDSEVQQTFPQIRIAPMADTNRLRECEVIVEGRLADIIFIGPYIKYRVLLDDDSAVIIHSSDFELRHQLNLKTAVRLGWRLRDQQIIMEQ